MRGESTYNQSMTIERLRAIGRRLFEEVGGMRLRPFSTASIGRGASGDKTFPIDKTAEDIIISCLEKGGEPLSVISEECGLRDIHGGGKKVIIDPIDGSKNAISGIPYYCTSVAVAEGDSFGTISLAYVIHLLTGDEFWAEAGKGAFFNGERISCQKDDTFYLIAYETQVPGRDLPPVAPLLATARKTRCLGAIALDLAYVAYGAVSILVSPAPSRGFDFAAGWLLVQEAGGIFTDTSGNALDGLPVAMDARAPLLASGNRALHERALGILNAGPR